MTIGWNSKNGCLASGRDPSIRSALGVGESAGYDLHTVINESSAMKVHHYFSGAALAASVVLTVVGVVKGAAVLVGLATAIEWVVSAVNGKKTNT